MKILAIRGQNLASLKGAFELDLVAPPLGGLGLFAIAGPVGAGKSTILDALCVALFGRTPRLSGRGGAPLSDEKDALRANDPRTLARKGAALAFAEVDFLGVDGRSWRARWQVRRARGQAFGRLLDDEHVLTDLQSGQRHGSTNQEVRQVIEGKLGLAFEELTRSVLLSQGGFAAFLQARPDERAALLEKITGTAIYGELSVRAFARAKEAAARVSALRDERARVDTLDDDERLRLLEAGRTRAQDRTALDASLASLSIAAAHAEERARRVQEHARAHARDAQARQAAQAAFGAERAAVATRDASAPVLERVRALDASRATLRLAALEDAARAALDEQAAAERRLADALQERDALDARQHEALRVLDHEAAIGGLLPRVDELCEQLDVMRGVRTQLEGARALLATWTERVADAAAALTDARACATEAQAAALAIADSLAPPLRALPVRTARAACARAHATLARAHADSLALELRVEERALERIGHAAARAALVDGEPCPLCGAVEHPFAHEAEPVTVTVQRAAVDALRLRIGALRDRVSACTATAETLCAEVPGGLVLDLDATALDAAEAALLARERAEGAAHEANERVRDAEQVLVDAEAQRTFGIGQTEQLTAREQQLSKQLTRALSGTGLSLDDDVGALTRSLVKRARAVQAARTQVDVVTAQLAEREPVLRADERGVDVARAHAAAAHSARADASERAARMEAERARLLEGRTLEALVFATGRALEEAVALHASARAEQSAAAAALEGARTELERAGPHDGGAEVIEALHTARAQLQVLVDEDARDRALLGVDDAARARRAALDAALMKEEGASRVWAELNELIGSHDGAKFRAFAQGLTLETLVHHANTHLALLAPRYRLERAAPARTARVELTLAVVDRDAGDERRAVQSLSGGETFLVSLALALGLASLSSSRVRVESLFIDEGFSSLDPDTLEVALSAFEALRSTGRQVGIISHVPALADRIGVQVRVVPLGDGRSRVDVRAG